MNTKVLKLATNNMISMLASSLYLRTGIDFTYPTQVVVQINETCNSKCVICDTWRGKRKEEITVQAWIEGIKKLKDAIGNYKISFVGGEVFLKNGIFDILEACHKEGVIFGITTNGILLNKENVERYISLDPFNVNISFDSLKHDVYESIRGVPCLDIIKSNIEYLIDYKQKVGSNIKITLKTVVNNLNLQELEDIAKYVNYVGVDFITFDPIKRKRDFFRHSVVSEIEERFEEMYNMDKTVLSGVIAKLKEMKKAGYKIMNSEQNMDQWLDYDNLTINNICTVPLRSLLIDPSGDIRLCDYIDTKIGNIQNKNLKAELKSSSTRKTKQSMVRCKHPCVYCIKRSFTDYVRLFRTFVS